MAELTEFERGVVVGLLIGEGSFGGDGKQPQTTLRMHTRDEALFEWLMARLPETRLYGPYHHGGRSYYQWMARGSVLVRDVLPVLEPELDEPRRSRGGALSTMRAAVRVVPLVGLPRRGEARVLPHGPWPARVHARVDAAGEGKLAGLA